MNVVKIDVWGCVTRRRRHVALGLGGHQRIEWTQLAETTGAGRQGAANIVAGDVCLTVRLGCTKNVRNARID